MNKEKAYFKTKSKTFCFAIQYVTNQNFFKFQDENNQTIYSFEIVEDFQEKVNKLNEIKFS